ncbi:MAG TPA: hypothetical protein VFR02_09255, partial [bacterium]|nr:hypothetical protein [bacterium]
MARSSKTPHGPQWGPPRSLIVISFFLLWVAAFSVLSYAPLGLQLKGWALVLGLVIPAFLLYRLDGSAKKKTVAPVFHAPPIWLWAALAGLALFLRFWKLTSLFVWPNADEGLCGAVIFQLHSHWDWRFFHSYGQAPPLLYWWGLLVLKLTRSPFLSLWLGPALISALTLPLMFLFLRSWWDDATAWIGTGLAAFSFWPLLIGRVNCQGDLLPAWECLLLFLLSRLPALPPARRPGAGFLLGLTAGLGFLTLTPWVAVAAWVVLLFFLPFPRSRSAREGVFFLGGLGSGLLLFSAVALSEGFGRHVAHLWAESGSGGSGRFLLGLLDYLAAVFTG